MFVSQSPAERRSSSRRSSQSSDVTPSLWWRQYRWDCDSYNTYSILIYLQKCIVKTAANAVMWPVMLTMWLVVWSLHSSGSYTDSCGSMYVRNTIAESISVRDGGVPSSPEQVFITVETQRGLMVRTRTICLCCKCFSWLETWLCAGDDATAVSVRGRVCGYDPRPRPSHSGTPPGEDGRGSGALSAARAVWVERGEGGA